MSDTDNDAAESPAAVAEPSDAGLSGPMFKVWRLVVNRETGDVTPRGVPIQLPAKVYDRATAVKYAAHEAQKIVGTDAEIRVAITSPAGRCVAVLAAGTGKPVRPLVAMRTKRVLAKLLPHEVKPRRATSRPAGRSVMKAGRLKRRTSRAVGRATKRGGR